MNKDEIKDKAAQQMGYESFKDYWNYQMKVHSWTEEVQFREHYAELYAASALSSVREKLPDHEEISQREGFDEAYSDYEQAFERGAHWAINQVKELLK